MEILPPETIEHILEYCDPVTYVQLPQSWSAFHPYSKSLYTKKKQQYMQEQVIKRRLELKATITEQVSKAVPTDLGGVTSILGLNADIFGNIDPAAFQKMMGAVMGNTTIMNIMMNTVMNALSNNDGGIHIATEDMGTLLNAVDGEDMTSLAALGRDALNIDMDVVHQALPGIVRMMNGEGLRVPVEQEEGVGDGHGDGVGDGHGNGVGDDDDEEVGKS